MIGLILFMFFFFFKKRGTRTSFRFIICKKEKAGSPPLLRWRQLSRFYRDSSVCRSYTRETNHDKLEQLHYEAAARKTTKDHQKKWERGRKSQIMLRP
ncbi:hypothetical protein QBC42DRAFT_269329 [Cladorrhinum samala]|uniref:Secreted protein n=1 Tax=Cladorrhinum samala TaxID=585594 RepID=A0AAV9HN44_9PEZI|nr:hypothetical protein QBC42DRAFT_269329 [Cladorrhinum samala]